MGVGSTFRYQAIFQSFLVLSPAGVLGVPLACLHSSESVMGEWLTGGLFQAVFAQPQPKPHARRMLVLPPTIEDVISTNNSNSSVACSSSSWEPLTLVGEEPPHDWALAAARTPQSPQVSAKFSSFPWGCSQMVVFVQFPSLLWLFLPVVLNCIISLGLPCETCLPW